MSLSEISIEDYEAALSISEDSDYQPYLKRPPNSCFVNNYFTDGLLAWEASIDIRPVFNHYKAVAYMCAYLSQSESECSQAMIQALKEAFEDKLDNYQRMKSLTQKYVNKRECSIQKCVSSFTRPVFEENFSSCYFLPILTFQKKDTGFVSSKRIYLSCQRIQEIFSKRI